MVDVGAVQQRVVALSNLDCLLKGGWFSHTNFFLCASLQAADESVLDFVVGDVGNLQLQIPQQGGVGLKPPDGLQRGDLGQFQLCCAP